MSELALSGNPTIMVVDDEELMREVVAIMIEENGGKVIEAVDGQDAVEKFIKNKDSVNCIIMDFSMPQMNGYEAYCEIARINDSVPVVIASGLSVTPEIKELMEVKKIDFINKPFHEEDLINIIKSNIAG